MDGSGTGSVDKILEVIEQKRTYCLPNMTALQKQGACFPLSHKGYLKIAGAAPSLFLLCHTAVKGAFAQQGYGANPRRGPLAGANGYQGNYPHCPGYLNMGWILPDTACCQLLVELEKIPGNTGFVCSIVTPTTLLMS